MTAPDPRMDAIKDRLGAATPGPWEAFASNDDYPPITHSIVTASHGDSVATLDDVDRATLREGPQATASNDAWFIANAPADVAYLLSVVEAQAGQIAKVRELAERWETTPALRKKTSAAELRAALAPEGPEA